MSHSMKGVCLRGDDGVVHWRSFHPRFRPGEYKADIMLDNGEDFHFHSVCGMTNIRAYPGWPETFGLVTCLLCLAHGEAWR